MRKILLFALAVVLSVGCSPKNEATWSNETNVRHPEWTRDAVVMEINVRQYTEEGTFAALEKHLDHISDLGVDILWIMPIHPIGQEGIKEPLGSYYSPRDYYAVNPEFGTMDDFDHFLSVAHGKGFKVILDWVANHTSRDAVWTEDHSDWYYRDSTGALATQYDWTDIAQLNYENNPDMWEAMIEAMKFWVVKGVDGFRCDVAVGPPVEFWDRARKSLEAVKSDVFMIAEAEEPALQVNAFDEYYTWRQKDVWYALAAGEVGVDSLTRFYENYAAVSGMPQGTIPMNFITNHDQNSWSGTTHELYGDNIIPFTAMTYLLPGMPMLYTGDEICLNKRLEFFSKDAIDWESDGTMDLAPLLKELKGLRTGHPVLWSQPYGGKMTIVPTDCSKAVFAFTRSNDDESLLALFNFSDDEVECTVEGFGKYSVSAHSFTVDQGGQAIINQ